MSHAEKVVKLVAKLYRARDAARTILRDRFAKQMETFAGFIRAEMKKSKCDAMKATMNLVKGLQKEKPDSGMTQVMVLAAYVEMTEPSSKEEKA